MFHTRIIVNDQTASRSLLSLSVVSTPLAHHSGTHESRRVPHRTKTSLHYFQAYLHFCAVRERRSQSPRRTVMTARDLLSSFCCCCFLFSFSFSFWFSVRSKKHLASERERGDSCGFSFPLKTSKLKKSSGKSIAEGLLAHSTFTPQSWGFCSLWVPSRALRPRRPALP